ncbi:S9 family peptidase [Jeotgalibaca sp. MA1X17-3]|uniref:S9 family peptidase n=1 Tax=Jeotgalibaca sp. MA1X17-3 TaxID=2908211 RepID=UPI001F304341|nr:S9 family peptidase [Jeotgalibaca sp. MA1X17-3]UJF15379.1 S9 family peptidase [Jeotgalibaca sp. MA1X17-3]
MKTFSNAESLYDLISLSSPALGENNERLFYVKTTINKEQDDYQSAIFAINLSKGEEIAIVENGMQNTCPSIQNQQLLYLSNKKGINQVFLLNLKNGKEKQLTFSSHSISHVQWIPDENSFLFTSQLEKKGRKTFFWNEHRDKKEKPKAPFYRIDHLNYQANGIGFINQDLAHYLCQQDIETGEVKVISTQSTGYGLRRTVDNNREGTIVYFEKSLVEDDEYNHDSGIFAYERETESLQHITKKFQTGIFSEAAISPNGNYLAMVGNPLPYETPNQFSLFLYSIKEETIKEITKKIDIQFADNSVSDFFQNVGNPILQWNPDSSTFFVQSSEYGRVNLYEGTLDGELKKISPDNSVVKEYIVSETGVLYAFISQPEDPVQIKKFKNNEWTTLSHSTNQYYSNYSYATYREIQYEATDGGIIHGLMVLPAHFDENQKYPLILNIHGGPYTMHSLNFYYEAQYLAANGYIVLLVNPRGSYGYGQKHTSGVYKRYGKEDYTDLMTIIDQIILDYSFVDDKNLFVTGGSYGGFMTNWIVTQTNRFKAAVSQRSMSNFVSMFGTSDIGYFFYKNEMGYDLSNAKELWKISPLAYVQQVETPTLLIHALEDLRCPFEQAQQFYNGLKTSGKVAEMLVFPDSNHELSRTGRPSYRVERLEAILEWFGRAHNKEE